MPLHFKAHAITSKPNHQREISWVWHDRILCAVWMSSYADNYCDTWEEWVKLYMYTLCYYSKAYWVSASTPNMCILHLYVHKSWYLTLSVIVMWYSQYSVASWGLGCSRWFIDLPWSIVAGKVQWVGVVLKVDCGRTAIRSTTDSVRVCPHYLYITCMCAQDIADHPHHAFS